MCISDCLTNWFSFICLCGAVLFLFLFVVDLLVGFVWFVLFGSYRLGCCLFGSFEVFPVCVLVVCCFVMCVVVVLCLCVVDVALVVCIVWVCVCVCACVVVVVVVVAFCTRIVRVLRIARFVCMVKLCYCGFKSEV